VSPIRDIRGNYLQALAVESTAVLSDAIELAT